MTKQPVDVRPIDTNPIAAPTIVSSARKVRIATAAVLMLGFAGIAASFTPWAQARIAPTANQGLKVLPLTVISGKQSHRFKVELAQTGAQQATGLMYRDAVAPDRGMIFPMTPPRRATFWMANVRMPLDILFVRANGTIARIAANAEPYSTAQIDSGEPVGLVLEIAGGRAAQLGIKPGDVVRWPGK